MSKPMEAMLNHVLDSSQTPGEAAVIIQFKSPVPPINGALRRHAKVSGIFELLAVASAGPNGKPFALANFFTADEVSRVMVVQEDRLPAIVAPPSAGGLIIPSG